MNKEIQLCGEKLRQPVAEIKKAILQGQYEACKGVNRIQLAVYFGIGKYISQNTRKGAWGTGALDTISNQLRRELPGLRGFSATSLKKMRLFYEHWAFLDAKSSVTTDNFNSSVTTDDISASTLADNSTTSIVKLEEIDIYNTIQVPLKTNGCGYL